MDLELRGKVALVTGASRGIGRGIAETLAKEGCKLLLTGRDEAALASVKAEALKRGAAAETMAIDLRGPDAGTTLVAAVNRTYGRLDILVNNAGTTTRGDFLTQGDDLWHEGFALKFFAHVRLTRAAWPLLCESHGSLVIIGGTAGKQPTANSIIGASVNGAINSFALALAQLGNDADVQVNVVSPGHVDTGRLQKRIDALKAETGLDEAAARERYRQTLGVSRLGLPRDVADLVAFVASPHGRWLHGTVIDQHGGQIHPI
ncbi:MAG TPA: SDR family NAD(P)-dependent oxidoreductase [Stellaceae bacterium]|nr:SDR family NAD(P)-dependent oxidoreductase [Stellaceae bacterium]